MSVLAFHPNIPWSAPGAFVPERPPIDPGLISRIKTAYRFSVAEFTGSGHSMWKAIEQKNADIHQALIGDDDQLISELLSNPRRTSLFYGFDSLFRERVDQMSGYTDEQLREIVGYLCDGVVRMAEATGAIRLWNPETGGPIHAGREQTTLFDIEQTISAIEQRVGIRIEFPNPFAGEFGIQTSRGIISRRTFQAIYQAWQLSALSKTYGARILEIGAGLGRTAYYAREFGLTDYTIVDIPMTIVALAMFLGQTLGPDAVALPGEAARAGQIKIKTPSGLLRSSEQFDVVLNVDSLTEMDREHATAYAEMIVARSKVFLSINHEINPFKVHDLSPFAGVPMQRFPYWMRKGYAEELFMIGQRSGLR